MARDIPGQAREAVVIVLGRCKTPVLELEICNLGTSWGLNFLRGEDFVGGSQRM